MHLMRRLPTSNLRMLDRDRSCSSIGATGLTAAPCSTWCSPTADTQARRSGRVRRRRPAFIAFEPDTHKRHLSGMRSSTRGLRNGHTTCTARRACVNSSGGECRCWELLKNRGRQHGLRQRGDRVIRLDRSRDVLSAHRNAVPCCARCDRLVRSTQRARVRLPCRDCSRVLNAGRTDCCVCCPTGCAGAAPRRVKHIASVRRGPSCRRCAACCRWEPGSQRDVLLSECSGWRPGIGGARPAHVPVRWRVTVNLNRLLRRSGISSCSE